MSTAFRLSSESTDVLRDLSAKLLDMREALLAELIATLTNALTLSKAHRKSINSWYPVKVKTLLELDSLLDHISVLSGNDPEADHLADAACVEIIRKVHAYPSSYHWLEGIAVIDSALGQDPVRKELEAALNSMEVPDSHAQQVRSERTRKSGWFRGFGRDRSDNATSK